MPLVDVRCDCGHAWEAITHLSAWDKCPNCGGKGNKQFSPPRRVIARGFMDEATYDCCIRQKQYLQENAHKITSGAWQVEETNGGKFMPDLPKTVY